LALKGKQLTAQERGACCHIVRPETILAWYRQLSARKYDSSGLRNVARRRKSDEIRTLVLRLANENLGWGYTKIRDALRGLNVEIGRTTVANILLEAGLTLGPFGTVRHMVFFAIEIKTRIVHIAGIGRAQTVILMLSASSSPSEMSASITS